MHAHYFFTTSAPPKPSLLSDHSPFMIQSNQFTALIWNILLQMRYIEGGGFYNNGFFCVQESDKNYINRLNHIAANIADFVTQQSPTCICLQECPSQPHLRQYFSKLLMEYDKLKEDYCIHLSKQDRTGFCLMTIYNKKLFTLSDDCKNLTAALADLKLKGGLAGRILPLALKNNSTDEITFIINVHAKFDSAINNDIKQLHAEIDNFKMNAELTIKDIIFAGDFNRNLTTDDLSSQHDVSDECKNNVFDGLHTYTIPDSSFSVKRNEEDKLVHVIETRDGVMSTFPIEKAWYLPTINTINPLLSSTGPISTNLQTFPEFFLQGVYSEMNQGPIIRPK